MASLRIIGDPEEVERVLAALPRAVVVADVSRRGSRYSETDVRVYAHVRPLASGDAEGEW
jgi:hypothetical protein